MLEQIPVPILKLLYPIREPNLSRDRPLTGLCLGLGRTGTDSLRTALQDLGYNGIHHGFHVAADHTGESPQWYRLCLAKFKNDDQAFLNRREFDKVLGHCEAVTDLPSAAFGVELLWYESQARTIDLLWRTWPQWTQSIFNSELFWLARITMWTAQRMADWGFQKNGVHLYHEHYTKLKEECGKQGRDYLDWTVEEGWTPLCEFLDKPVPQKPFPKENDQSAFDRRRMQFHAARIANATRNMAVTSVLLALALGLLAHKVLNRGAL